MGAASRDDLSWGKLLETISQQNLIKTLPGRESVQARFGSVPLRVYGAATQI